MILSRLQQFAGMILVLALTTGTLSAQRGNGRIWAKNSQNAICLNQISGLTTEQTDKIKVLDNKHRDEMAELREERRSTTYFSKKYEIRTEMQKKVEEHRAEVKSVLNAEQQKEFDAIQPFGKAYAQQGNRFGNGNNGACGYRQGNRGNGNCQGIGNGNRGKNRKQMKGNNKNFQNGYRGGFNSSNS